MALVAVRDEAVGECVDDSGGGVAGTDAELKLGVTFTDDGGDLRGASDEGLHIAWPGLSAVRNHFRTRHTKESRAVLFDEGDTGDPPEDNTVSAIRVLVVVDDSPCACDGEDVRRAIIGLFVARLEPRDSHRSGPLDAGKDHLSIAFFEDMEWQKRAWEEDNPRQGKDRQRFELGGIKSGGDLVTHFERRVSVVQ